MNYHVLLIIVITIHLINKLKKPYLGLDIVIVVLRLQLKFIIVLTIKLSIRNSKVL